MSFRLHRTVQCAKCPWRKDVDPTTIPDGYSVEKHEDLRGTIATPGDLSGLFITVIKVMACHETADAHCIGWLINQLGAGNNIALRVKMGQCENLGDVRTIGDQHESFDDTLPK